MYSESDTNKNKFKIDIYRTKTLVFSVHKSTDIPSLINLSTRRLIDQVKNNTMATINTKETNNDVFIYVGEGKFTPKKILSASLISFKRIFVPLILFSFKNDIQDELYKIGTLYDVHVELIISHEIYVYCIGAENSLVKAVFSIYTFLENLFERDCIVLKNYGSYDKLLCTLSGVYSISRINFEGFLGTFQRNTNIDRISLLSNGSIVSRVLCADAYKFLYVLFYYKETVDDFLSEQDCFLEYDKDSLQKYDVVQLKIKGFDVFKVQKCMRKMKGLFQDIVKIFGDDYGSDEGRIGNIFYIHIDGVKRNDFQGENESKMGRSSVILEDENGSEHFLKKSKKELGIRKYIQKDEFYRKECLNDSFLKVNVKSKLLQNSLSTDSKLIENRFTGSIRVESNTKKNQNIMHEDEVSDVRCILKKLNKDSILKKHNFLSFDSLNKQKQNSFFGVFEKDESDLFGFNDNHNYAVKSGKELSRKSSKQADLIYCKDYLNPKNCEKISQNVDRTIQSKCSENKQNSFSNKKNFENDISYDKTPQCLNQYRPLHEMYSCRYDPYTFISNPDSFVPCSDINTIGYAKNETISTFSDKVHGPEDKMFTEKINTKNEEKLSLITKKSSLSNNYNHKTLYLNKMLRSEIVDSINKGLDLDSFINNPNRSKNILSETESNQKSACGLEKKLIIDSSNSKRNNLDENDCFIKKNDDDSCFEKLFSINDGKAKKTLQDPMDNQNLNRFSENVNRNVDDFLDDLCVTKGSNEYFCDHIEWKKLKKVLFKNSQKQNVSNKFKVLSNNISYEDANKLHSEISSYSDPYKYCLLDRSATDLTKNTSNTVCSSNLIKKDYKPQDLFLKKNLCEDTKLENLSDEMKRLSIYNGSTQNKLIIPHDFDINSNSLSHKYEFSHYNQNEIKNIDTGENLNIKTCDMVQNFDNRSYRPFSGVNFENSGFLKSNETFSNLENKHSFSSQIIEYNNMMREFSLQKLYCDKPKTFKINKLLNLNRLSVNIFVKDFLKKNLIEKNKYSTILSIPKMEGCDFKYDDEKIFEKKYFNKCIGVGKGCIFELENHFNEKIYDKSKFSGIIRHENLQSESFSQKTNSIFENQSKKLEIGQNNKSQILFSEIDGDIRTDISNNTERPLDFLSEKNTFKLNNKKYKNLVYSSDSKNIAENISKKSHPDPICVKSFVSKNIENNEEISQKHPALYHKKEQNANEKAYENYKLKNEGSLLENMSISSSIFNSSQEDNIQNTDDLIFLHENNKTMRENSQEHFTVNNEHYFIANKSTEHSQNDKSDNEKHCGDNSKIKYKIANNAYENEGEMFMNNHHKHQVCNLGIPKEFYHSKSGCQCNFHNNLRDSSSENTKLEKSVRSNQHFSENRDKAHPSRFDKISVPICYKITNKNCLSENTFKNIEFLGENNTTKYENKDLFESYSYNFNPRNFNENENSSKQPDLEKLDSINEQVLKYMQNTAKERSNQEYKNIKTCDFLQNEDLHENLKKSMCLDPYISNEKMEKALYSENQVKMTCTDIKTFKRGYIAIGMRSDIKKLLVHNYKRFELEIETDCELEDFLCGKKNGKINKIAKDNECDVTIEHRNENNLKTIGIYISGQGNKLLKTINQLENEYPAELCFYLNEKYHKRIIGYGGKNIQKIMKKHGVYIKFMNEDERITQGFDGNVIIKTPQRNKESLIKMQMEVLDIVDEQIKKTTFELKKIKMFYAFEFKIKLMKYFNDYGVFHMDYCLKTKLECQESQKILRNMQKSSISLGRYFNTIENKFLQYSANSKYLIKPALNIGKIEHPDKKRSFIPLENKKKEVDLMGIKIQREENLFEGCNYGDNEMKIKTYLIKEEEKQSIRKLLETCSFAIKTYRFEEYPYICVISTVNLPFEEIDARKWIVNTPKLNFETFNSKLYVTHKSNIKRNLSDDRLPFTFGKNKLETFQDVVCDIKHEQAKDKQK